MIRRLAILILFFSIGGGLLTGVSVFASEQDCAEPGMMDCCKTARKLDNSHEADAARICCAVNRPSSGATTTTAGIKLQQFIPLILTFYRPYLKRAFILPPAKPAVETARLYSVSILPAYLKHSAFLI
ncbi:MAG: hypothetical protein M3033_04390 [Acidobacteriota bacterium]|nr:hypothetical protein [Acidobacteriota bacterium]